MKLASVVDGLHALPHGNHHSATYPAVVNNLSDRGLACAIVVPRVFGVFNKSILSYQALHNVPRDIVVVHSNLLSRPWLASGICSDGNHENQRDDNGPAKQQRRILLANNTAVWLITLPPNS